MKKPTLVSPEGEGLRSERCVHRLALKGEGAPACVDTFAIIMDGVVKKGIKKPRWETPNEVFMILAIMADFSCVGVNE
jgi:hypothetical protein